MAVFFEVPFPYSARFVRRRHQNPETATFVSRIPVGVREVSGRDAPVVARLSCGEAHAELDYRLLDGQLLRVFSAGMAMPGTLASLSSHRVLRSHEAQADFDAWFQAITRRAAPEGRPMFNNYTLLGRAFTTRSMLAEDQVEARRWLASDRQRQEARIRQVMQQSAFVDGVLYVPSLGPAWVTNVDRWFPEEPDNPVVIAPSLGVAPELGWLWMRLHAFRADCRADAENYIRDKVETEFRDGRYGAQPVRMERGLRKDGDIVICDPRAFGAGDEHRYALLDAAERIIDWTTPLIGELETDVIRCFADLKRMYADEDASPAMADAAETVFNAAEARFGSPLHDGWSPIAEYRRRVRLSGRAAPTPDDAAEAPAGPRGP